MKIFLATLLILLIVLAIMYLILDRSRSEQTENKENYFLTILSAFVGASIFVCITIIPSVVLFFICLGIENFFPHLLKSDSFYDLMLLAILSMGITFIFEVFFKGFFTGFSRYFKLPRIINIVGAILIYTIIFYFVTEKFIENLHLTIVGALILSIIMVLIDSLLNKFIKMKK
ncbi:MULTISPECIES: hypothetical protein [Bacillus cereus group]|uniref:hypothetical protein n=1 Tax=Bacillus cereus group TaxID=86661 RepID=UPI001F56FDD0|nr:hypothetical protein [Bacillus cereus group sp. BfR-BA-01381]